MDLNENCMVWCNNHDSCGGFTLWSNRCFFKNMSCGNDIINASNTILYMKKGGHKYILQKVLEKYLTGLISSSLRSHIS